MLTSISHHILGLEQPVDRDDIIGNLIKKTRYTGLELYADRAQSPAVNVEQIVLPGSITLLPHLARQGCCM